MSFRQKLTGKIADHLPTVDPDNLEDSLRQIREAAHEYYAKKKGTWKPKVDWEAEDREHARRLGYDPGLPAWAGSMMRYSMGDVKIARIDHDLPSKMETLRKVMAVMDFSAVETRIQQMIMDKAKNPYGERTIDLETRDEMTITIDESHKIERRFLYGDWDFSKLKAEPITLGAGKNPFAEHTIRRVKAKDIFHRSRKMVR